MPVTQCMPTSAKAGFLAGTYVAADVYRISLFLASASSLDANSTTYTIGMAGELATAGGYTQGGINMVGYTPGTGGTEAWIDWTTDPQWTSATFTSDAAVIYNSSKANAIIAILSFGSATVASGTFTVQFPTPAAGTAIIRIA